jgi:hypothetical protein
MEIDNDKGATAIEEEETRRHNKLYNELKTRMRRAETRHREDLQNVRTTVPSTATTDDGDASAHWQALKAAKTPEAEIERYIKLQSTQRTKAEAEHDKDLHELRMSRFLTKGSRDQNAACEVACALGAEQASSQTQQFTPGQEDPDFALALQLQEEEYREAREAEQRQASPTEEEEQIRRYNELQVTSRIKNLEQQMEHIRNVRDNMMREMQSRTTLRTGQQLDSESQHMAGPERRRGRDREFEQKAPPSPPLETPSDVPETSRPRLVIPFSSGQVANPSLKRTDTETFKVPAKPPSPPPKTQWRDQTRQRGRPNLDFSRIETHFLLTHDFIDDVNAMLDVIDGWSDDQIKDFEYAFKKDVDNRGRSIEFVEIDSRQWGVRLLNPTNPERRDSLGMLCPFRSSDNPQNICQNLGSKECSNKAYTEERTASLNSFRDQQNMLPPPLPLRSDKRKAPPGPSQAAKPLAAPAAPSPLVDTPRPLDSTRTGSRSLAKDDMRQAHVENVERGGSKIWTQVEQVKNLFKAQAEGRQGKQAEGRELVRQFLQNLDLTPKASAPSRTPERQETSERPRTTKQSMTLERPQPSEHPQASNHLESSEQPRTPEQPKTSGQTVRYHPDDNASSTPTPGKLKHRERIPTGPHSLRREDLSFTSTTNARGGRPYGPWAEAVHDKPREQYYTEANTITEEWSDEEDSASASSPEKKDQLSIDSAIQSAISSNKPKLSFRPQYLKHPDAY